MSFPPRCPLTAQALLIIFLPCASGAAEFAFKDILLVPLRVHLLSSKETPALQTTLATSDVERIFQKVNRVWAQAGIQFFQEPLISEPAAAPGKRAGKGLEAFLDRMPETTVSGEAFNIYYIKSFDVNGVYFKNPEAIFVKDTASLRKVEGGIDEPIPRVTSHELGHALSLPHRQDTFNLMASGTTGTLLNEAEIRQARESAVTRKWILPATKWQEKAEALEKDGRTAEARTVYQRLATLPLDAAPEVLAARLKAGTATSPTVTAQTLPVTPPNPDSVEEWRTKMLPQKPRGYVCPHTATPVNVDGKLDDPAWTDAPWTEDFVDIQGDAKPKPHFRTRAKMTWDDQFLYIAAEIDEPHVWGTLTEHDTVIFQDPDFEVFIDPDGDTHEYYEFELNALNTGWDLYLPKPYKDGGGADNSWSIPGLKTAVHVRGTLNNPADRDEGWSVEIAMPWNVLAVKANRPAPPAEGDQWRLGFSRVEWPISTEGGKYTKVPNTPEDNWIWSPQGVIDMHRPERWGYVQFTKKKGTAFVPDASLSARDALMDVYYAQRAFRKKNEKWATSLTDLGITPRPPLAAPAMQATAEGWEAILEFTPPGAKLQKLKIRQDSLLRPVP